MYELALFAGAGGGILGGMLSGFECVGAVEIEEYPRKVLFARQRDGIIEKFPIWDDVQSFSIDNQSCLDYIEFLQSIRGELSITGGFPCQDISTCKRGAKGLNGERSGLWREQKRIIGEIRPAVAFVENSSALIWRGIGTVFADLVSMGYDCTWGVFSADMSGGYHYRKRVFILGYLPEVGNVRILRKIYERTNSKGSFWRSAVKTKCPNAERVRMFPECDVFRMADGVADELDRIAAVGNGQDAAVVRMAYGVLSEIILRKYGVLE